MARTVHIVPHTHWDREWYRTFQSFRMELVDVVDDTIELLERNDDYAHFMLDGQMAAVDDYLEIRPTNEARIGRLAEAGRLVMGPWYILMDEFLVSGETIIRNLARGIERAADFGGAMTVGYLPDMFGHIAQMPQILREFGFDDAVVWRGVPESCTRTPAFTWEALDGSTVAAQYLPRGYGNGVGLPPDAASLVQRVALYCAQVGDAAGGADAPVLWMHGTDHRHPIEALAKMVAEANAEQDDWHFVISTLPDYITEQHAAASPTVHWRGELRSGARANLLMGVASNRVDVKQAAARAERTLERLAEPMTALFRRPDDWPVRFLDQAWLRMIHNSAHDSICACSHDDVVLAVLDRFAEAEAIGQGLVERAMVGAYRHARPAFDAAGPVAAIVVNPSQRTRSGIVEVAVPTAELPAGTQERFLLPARLPMVTRAATDAATWLKVVNDQIGDVHRVEVTETDDGSVDVDLFADQRRFGLLEPEPALAHLRSIAADRPEAEVRFWYCGIADTHQVLIHVADVPGFGWRCWEPGESEVTPVEIDADGRGMHNGVIAIRVADDGSYSIDEHDGLGLLVDDGDRGDTYNFCAVGNADPVVGLTDVRVTVVESGPLRARLQIDGLAHWPAFAFGDERVGPLTTAVTTVLELQAGQDLLHVTVRFDNRSRSHRLRAVFPLAIPTASSKAECAFGIVERGIDAEGGPSEPAMATQPSRRFVQAGDLTLAHEGLLEYELVDLRGSGDDRRAHAIALTLLRSTGMLSQPPMPSRPLPAGPFDPAEAAQMQGNVTLRYAVAIGDRDPYAMVDDAFLPLLVAGSKQALDVPPHSTDAEVPRPERSAALLSVDGAEVSALRRLDTSPTTIELRVFNPTNEPTQVTIIGLSGTLVDLAGNGAEPFDETFTLRPWGIQTVLLDGVR